MIRGVLNQAGAGRNDEARGRPARPSNTVPETEEEALAYPAHSLFREAYYYRTPRGQHPRSVGKLLSRSAETARFNVEAVAKMTEFFREHLTAARI